MSWKYRKNVLIKNIAGAFVTTKSNNENLQPVLRAPSRDYELGTNIFYFWVSVGLTLH